MEVLKHYDILFIMTLSFSYTWEKPLKDYPEECFTPNEIDDDTRRFSNYKVPTSKADDLELQKGWYRIMGKKANSLKQGFEKSLAGSKITPPNFCGTVYAGTLMGEHPTPDQGIVEMTVCFRSNYCFFENIKSCTCKSKKIIYVRNCKKHYIYWLSPTGRQERYCTGKTSLSGPQTTEKRSYAIECEQYGELDDSSRVWDKIADVKTDKEEGWYRFLKEAGQELSSGCSLGKGHISRMAQPCGAAFRGWMIDRHPSLAEGHVSRRICFSYSKECDCEFFANIAVRNCGTYFVYRLKRPPLDNARYCGASRGLLSASKDAKKPPVEKAKNVCDMYQIRHDPDRLWSHTSPTVKKCDAHFYGKYRFGSKYTPWSIKQGCNKTDMSVVTHRCGSKYQGFMEGRHPSVSEGYVERIICFQEASAPCECSFTTIIGVQNCSGFYVYNLQGVPTCHSRFCMVANKTSSIKIDPGRPPMYDIPVPGHKPVVVSKSKRDNKENKSLIITTTVLSIILLIVLVILIAIIILLLFCIWPMYKRRKSTRKRYPTDNNIPIGTLQHTDSKMSGSNGSLPREQVTNDLSHHLTRESTNNNEDFVDISIPPRPSRAPPIEQPVIFSPELPPMPSDDDDEDESEKKSPVSDTSFPELPEEVKDDDDSDEEYDTLMKKDDVKKPEPYTPFDSAV